MQNRPTWPSWLLTAMALLGLVGLACGQGEPLSELATAPALTTIQGTEVPGIPTAPAQSITDDGRGGDEWLEARQLIIALTSDHARSIAVHVLDERGRVVRSCALQAPAGRRALALDVSTLARGRYVARIGDAQVVRFIR